MRFFTRWAVAAFCVAMFMGATGLDSGGGSGVSEQHVLRSGSLGAAFSGVTSVAGPYRLMSVMPAPSPPPDLVGDFNADGAVTFGDFLLFAQGFGKNQDDPSFDAKFDLNDNGQVAFDDFLIFAVAFDS